MQKFNLYLKITRAEKPSYTIDKADIKTFDPINNSQILKVDNKHDFLKVMKRIKKFNSSTILISKANSRAERLRNYKEIYKGYSIKELNKIGINI